MAAAVRALGGGVPGHEEWDADRTGKPRLLAEALPEFPAGEAVASRDAGKAVMQALKPFTPTMLGGAADLVESTKTEFEGAGLFSKQHAGRNIPFGIREHAMGSIVNGIGLDAGNAQALRLDLPDLLRLHAARGPALGARAHAVALGLDARLGRRRRGRADASADRAPHGAPAIPNLWYVARRRERDRDGVADRARARGRPGRARSRQKLPTLDRTEVAPAEDALRGGYMLWQSGDGLPDILLLATGSELGVAYEAAQAMDANVRVVSMPCWELFAEQPQDYRDEVIPPDVRARLSVEAGISHGWERWIGDAGASVAIDRFGASAPGDEVLRNLGFRPRTWPRAPRLCSNGSHERRGGVRPPGRKLRERVLQGSRRRARGSRPRHGLRRAAGRLPGQGASRARRSSPARRSGACSSAARASAPRSPPASSRGSAPRSADVYSLTRASSTTT